MLRSLLAGLLAGCGPKAPPAPDVRPPPAAAAARYLAADAAALALVQRPDLRDRVWASMPNLGPEGPAAWVEVFPTLQERVGPPLTEATLSWQPEPAALALDHGDTRFLLDLRYEAAVLDSEYKEPLVFRWLDAVLADLDAPVALVVASPSDAEQRVLVVSRELGAPAVRPSPFHVRTTDGLREYRRHSWADPAGFKHRLARALGTTDERAGALLDAWGAAVAKELASAERASMGFASLALRSRTIPGPAPRSKDWVLRFKASRTLLEGAASGRWSGLSADAALPAADGLTPEQVRAVADTIARELVETTGAVELPGVGLLQCVHRESMTFTNPATGAVGEYPERWLVAFRQADGLKPPHPDGG